VLLSTLATDGLESGGSTEIHPGDCWKNAHHKDDALKITLRMWRSSSPVWISVDPPDSRPSVANVNSTLLNLPAEAWLGRHYRVPSVVRLSGRSRLVLPAPAPLEHARWRCNDRVT